MSDQYFRHVDGGLYRFVAHARSADDTSELVVYEHVWPNERGLWVRKRAEFEYRFAPIDDAAAAQLQNRDRAQLQKEITDAKAARRKREAAAK